MPRRILVTGCRHWHCEPIATHILRSIRERDPDVVIVHGDAPGVDRTFRRCCEQMGIAHEPHAADWQRLGHGAGPRRNAEMVALGAEYAIAVHRDLAGSRGTRDCVRRCLEAGIPVYLVDGENPTRRITEV